MDGRAVLMGPSSRKPFHLVIRQHVLLSLSPGLYVLLLSRVWPSSLFGAQTVFLTAADRPPQGTPTPQQVLTSLSVVQPVHSGLKHYKTNIKNTNHANKIKTEISAAGVFTAESCSSYPLVATA